MYLFKSVTVTALYSICYYSPISFIMLAKIPFTNVLDVSSPYFLASSTTSFTATLYGIFANLISYIASFSKLKSIFETLFNSQPTTQPDSVRDWLCSRVCGGYICLGESDGCRTI